MLKSRRRDLLVAVLIFILSISFFYKIFFNSSEMIFPAHDIVGVYDFWRKFFVESVKQFGQIPLWNPYQFSGTPFIANPSSGMFYPPNLLFFLFPTDIVFGYTFMLDMFLLGIFTYLFARTIKLERVSAFVAALVMMWSGVVTSRIIAGHSIILDTIAWFPLLLFFYEKALQTKEVHYGFYAAVPLALMIIAGHTQFAIFGILAALLYLLLRVIFDRIFRKGLVFIPLISIVLGFGLSAIQLFPMIELSRLSGRSEGVSFDFASDFSLHPLQTLSGILPYFFGSPLDNTFWGKGNYHELSFYIGIAPFLLIVITLLFQRNKYIIIAAIIAAFSFLYAFGKYSFIFPLFYKFAPLFDSFRAPGRFLFVFVFFAAILVGFGMQFLQKKKFAHAQRKKIRLVSLLFFSMSACALVGVLFLYFSDGFAFYQHFILRNSFAQGIDHNVLYHYFLRDVSFFILFVVLMAFFLTLKINNKISVSKFNFVIICIIILDLLLFSQGFVLTKKPSEVFKAPGVIKQIKQDKEKFRVFDMTGALIAYVNRNGLESITTHDSSYMRSYRDFLWAMGPHKNWPFESFIQIEAITHPEFLSLLNTKYIVTDKEITVLHFKKIAQVGGYWLYKNNGMFERSFVVPQAVVMPSDTILKAIETNAVDLRKTVILEEKPSEKIVNEEGNYSLRITVYEPDKIQVDVSLSQPGYLVLSEIWYPGWKAFVDGKEVKIYRANYLFRSIYLTGGKHSILFVYQPTSYIYGKLISIISVVILLISLFFFWRKRITQ